MAIDTAAKRLSALDFEEVWAEAIPNPDGSVGQGDRLHLVWSYCGILMGGVSVKGAVSVSDAGRGGVSLVDALWGGVSVGEAGVDGVSVEDE